MRYTSVGPVPEFTGESLSEAAVRVCPAYKLSYPDLYHYHYGQKPVSWLLGHTRKVYVGHVREEQKRRSAASGGVITSTLCHLLESGRVDGVVAVRQGLPNPRQARVVICTTKVEIEACAGSVYIPVSVLDILRELDPRKKYAITCLPDQSAALRAMQREKFEPANLVKYVLGPYTGTALCPSAIDYFLKSKRIGKSDSVSSLKWRAGEWPGYLEIQMASGKMFRSSKVYYNYLTPFFVTQNSLQNMDFSNEFCDLAVGDAWSPVFEKKGGGYSVFATRSESMEAVIEEMIRMGKLVAQEEDPVKASEMHGHMLDFKKRGGYIRNRIRQRFGLQAPDFGVRPDPLPWSRYVVEIFIVAIFYSAGTRLGRYFMLLIPEKIIGPLFNRVRLIWKAVSKPTKRKGLSNLTMKEVG